MKHNGVGAGAAWSLGSEPLKQMIWLIRKGTHVRGAHIEQMPRIVRAVGEAATDLFCRLNHNDLGRAYG